MQDNTHTFTIDVKGLPLTEEHKAAISQALNDTLMHQIGQLDFRSKTAGAEAQAIGGSSFGYVIGIEGGILERISKRTDFLKKALQNPQLDRSINVGVQQFNRG